MELKQTAEEETESQKLKEEMPWAGIFIICCGRFLSIIYLLCLAVYSIAFFNGSFLWFLVFAITGPITGFLGAIYVLYSCLGYAYGDEDDEAF